MLGLRFHDAPRPFRLLCLGAHPDDIEIGCAGTIMRLVEEIPELSVRWVVFTATAERAVEARGSAAEILAASPDSAVLIHDFRDGFMPFHGTRVKEAFERLKQEFDPTLVLTHAMGDAHQDHRLIAEMSHATFRNHLVLEYEIPKHDGDLGNPNFFVPLTEAQARRKAAALLRHFASQRQRPWFAEDVFLAMMRLRGAFSHAPGGFAEGFYCRKAMLG
jgi:LmbE family N-acetylglucosaminyl deacetylase